MWKRKVGIKVFEDPEYKSLIFDNEELRIDFNLSSTQGEAVDTCRIDLFNLSREVVVKLASAESSYVRLHAGYEDEQVDGLMLVFEGKVFNTWARRQVPEHITSLFCLAHVAKDLEKVVELSVTGKSDTLRTVLDRLAKEIGYPQGITPIGMENEVLSQPIKARSFVGKAKDVLDELAKSQQFSYKPKRSSLRVTPTLKEGSLDRMLSINNGILHTLELEKTKGMPQLGDQIATIPYVLSPLIMGSDVIDLSKFVDSKAKVDNYASLSYGEDIFLADAYLSYATLTSYLVDTALHQGSNYEDVWKSTIKGIRHSATTVGGKK